MCAKPRNRKSSTIFTAPSCDFGFRHVRAGPHSAHLRNNIEDPRNTVLITGFMAQDTLGASWWKSGGSIDFGEPMRVRAEISSLDELSGHADQRELLQWIEPLARTLRKVFLVHGEPQQSETLARLLHATTVWKWRSRLGSEF